MKKTKEPKEVKSNVGKNFYWIGDHDGDNFALLECALLSEGLDFGCLDGNLFQCYVDNNGTKCKGSR